MNPVWGDPETKHLVLFSQANKKKTAGSDFSDLTESDASDWRSEPRKNSPKKLKLEDETLETLAKEVYEACAIFSTCPPEEEILLIL